MTHQPVPLLDLAAQRARLEPGLSAAIARVLDHGQFIMGPEVTVLEQRLVDFTGAGHAVTCANGTDALVLVMMAEGIGPGDAVIVPSFTFVATAEAVALRGAVPVFADVDTRSYNVDPHSVERAIGHARTLGLRPRMVIAVDLFGLPADYQRLREVASGHDLCLVADAAQSFGATHHGRRVGVLADYTTTSFFPSKPFGCYGDGGAVLTDDPQRADLLASLRVHGKGGDKYDNVRIGLNSRLDTLQAAVLLAKLPILDDERTQRQRIADHYDTELSGTVAVPQIPEGSVSAWAQYTITCASAQQRAAIQESCSLDQIGTAIYYPRPLHRQAGYRSCPGDPNGLGVSEHLAETVLSIPMHPYLDTAALDRVISAVADVSGRSRRPPQRLA